MLGTQSLKIIPLNIFSTLCILGFKLSGIALCAQYINQIIDYGLYSNKQCGQLPVLARAFLLPWITPNHASEMSVAFSRVSHVHASIPLSKWLSPPVVALFSQSFTTFHIRRKTNIYAKTPAHTHCESPLSHALEIYPSGHLHTLFCYHL